jgi:serine protease
MWSQCAALSASEGEGMERRIRRTLIVGVILSLCSMVELAHTRSAFAQGLPATKVIVKWRANEKLAAQSADALAALRDAEARSGAAATSMRMLATGGELLRLNQSLSQEALHDFLETLRKSGAVDYAEEDSILHTMMNPNDELYEQYQWHLFGAIGGIKVPVAWDRTVGQGIRVAVLDSGIRPHTDLSPNLVGGYDFVTDLGYSQDGDGRDPNPDSGNPDAACGSDSVHGTLVAGIIGAVANNHAGIAGVAPGARILPVRIGAPCGGAYLSDLAEAIVWAAGGSVLNVPPNPYPARVLNLSLGAHGGCPGSLQSAIDFAESRQAIVITSAGNDATDAAEYNPPNCRNAFTVAATSSEGGKASYSNFGSVVDVAAPGQWVMTVLPGSASRAENYGSVSGTSMAAPLVSGVAALVLSQEPSLTASQLRVRLRTTARPFPAACAGCGTGIVNARAATAPPGAGPAPPGDIDAIPTQSFNGQYSVDWPSAAEATHYVIERSSVATTAWGEGIHTLTTYKQYLNQQGGRFKHRVKACNNYGCGHWIEGAQVSVCNGCEIP